MNNVGSINLQPKPVKALSGYAEWFWLMAKNWKDVENRDWSLTRYFRRADLPVRVYLHASKTPASREELAFIREKLDAAQLDEFDHVDWKKYRGSIIGEITIIDEVTMDDTGMKITKSPWFFGKFGFAVEDGELYDEPIPYRGQLGFFEVNIGGKR